MAARTFMQKLNGVFTLIGAICFLTLLNSCNSGGSNIPDLTIVNKALNDPSSLFYANYRSYPTKLKQLPVGMFDSGTGGLTVMEQFLAADYFDNKTGEEIPDGIPDFDGEDFIYLADQANMPYGVYPSQGKTDFLRELIIKDALFLTSGVQRTKLIVIACNTATAYGLDDVRGLMHLSGTGVKVSGVIEAGAEGAMSVISPNERTPYAVGVLATVGTISSGGYESAIKGYVKKRSYSGEIKVVNQGGLGFAEAVDSETDYIYNGAKEVRSNYRGPAMGQFPDGIDTSLLWIYNFDNSANSLLTSTDSDGNLSGIQLNSTGNYARFHMVTLIEKHRRDNPGTRLKSVILGCTHYPYLTDTLIKVVDELRMVELDGIKIYDDVLSEELIFIDPAVNTAKEVFRTLFRDRNLSGKSTGNNLKGYISVTRDDLAEEHKDKNGNMTFEYKYGRETGSDYSAVNVVPFSIQNINRDNLRRIKERLPLTYLLIKNNIGPNDL